MDLGKDGKAITYFIESTEYLKPFPSTLPFGILATDSLEGIVGRIGNPPTAKHFMDGEEL